MILYHVWFCCRPIYIEEIDWSNILSISFDLNIKKIGVNESWSHLVHNDNNCLILQAWSSSKNTFKLITIIIIIIIIMENIKKMKTNHDNHSNKKNDDDWHHEPIFYCYYGRHFVVVVLVEFLTMMIMLAVRLNRIKIKMFRNVR